jgi:hypothetical protein
VRLSEPGEFVVQLGHRLRRAVSVVVAEQAEQWAAQVWGTPENRSELVIGDGAPRLVQVRPGRCRSG